MKSQDWTDPARSKVTVADIAPDWLASLSVKPKTRTSYESVLVTCVLPEWGGMRLDRITLGAVKRWVANMVGGSGRPLSASRKTQAYRVLTWILDAAVEDGRLGRNPARPPAGGVRRSSFLPRQSQPKAKRYLSHDQLHSLASSADDYGTLILLLGYTGLRFGEAAALRVNDVDLLSGRVRVDESLADVNGRLLFGPTKTHQARTVPIPAFLKERLSLQLFDKGRDDLVFTSPQGDPIRLANWRRRVFDRAVTAVGLHGLTPHGLRHTAASLAVASGANVKAVQAMLGHQDAALTLNVYADLFDGDLDDVAERMNAAAEASLVYSSCTPALGSVSDLRPADASQAS